MKTDWFDDSAVYERTPQGAREVVIGALPLTPWQQRFLAMANGHTPLRVLLDLAGSDDSAITGIDDLVSRGLLRMIGGIQVR